MPNDRRRFGERGLSLIEALVIVTLTALLALLLLPLASRTAGRNFALAERGIDLAVAADAEAKFRALSEAHIAGDGGVWSARSIILRPSLSANMACARAGGPTPTRLAISESGLVCEQGRARQLVLQWREGEARFSFSADGRRWARVWSGVQAPRFVRFQIVDQDQLVLNWVASLGHGLPEGQSP